MTDLLHTIPDFPTNHYTHLLPSLEKHLITTTDLLTLDALDVAKRAQLPLLDVRRLKEHVLAILQGQLGLKHDSPSKFEGVGEGSAGFGSLKKSGNEITRRWSFISTLDDPLDAALGGGIPTGYITEITGESGAGKTQLLLSLLLTTQLPPPHGLSRPTLYISTEHPLPTTRLSQLLLSNPTLSTATSPPSLSQILTLQTPDLESQDHILTYQLPVALARHNIGLVVIDSIAANYRADHTPSALATRSAQLIRLGGLLRRLATHHDCAIVAANQVADRFLPAPLLSSRATPTNPAAAATAWSSSSPASTPTTHTPAAALPSTLTLDHQQRFFTGWGDGCPARGGGGGMHDLKTPSLGLVWANQIAARVALVKEVGHVEPGWRRWMRVVFAAWVAGCAEGERGVEFEIWAGGLRGVLSAESKGDAGDHVNAPMSS